MKIRQHQRLSSSSLSVAFFAILLAIAVPRAASDNIIFPTDCGYINVKNCGAKGNGTADDTDSLLAAIRRAIGTQNRYSAFPMLYLPNGTYRVSKPMEVRLSDTTGWSKGWLSGFLMIGENRDSVVIKLTDNNPLFGDTVNQLPVLKTGSENPNSSAGSGNQAFRHHVMNLTIDIGTGNPGAVGIDYLANNRGTVGNVTIRSSDPGYRGSVGLKMTRVWPGPCLIRNVTIVGFNYGIQVGQYEYSQTYETISLRNQRIAGITNDNNVLCINNLTSINSVPAISGGSDNGLITLVNAQLNGGATGNAAIICKNKIFCRSVMSSGYGKLIDDLSTNNRDVTSPSIDEYTNFNVVSTFPSPTRSLNLPIEQAPEFHTNDFSQWANVVTAGASPNNGADDDASGIQAAIDAGKSIVYLPCGNYAVGATIIIRGTVRKIMGFHSSISARSGASVDPLIRFEGTSHDDVILEFLRIGGAIEHASSKGLALRCLDHGGYRTAPTGTGKLFAEDVIGVPYRITTTQHAWLRQVNCEFAAVPFIQNTNGTLWILGYKTEGKMTVLTNKNGSVELLGALFYPVYVVPDSIPLMVNEEGSLSASYAISGGGAKSPLYTTQVREARGGQWKSLPYSGVPGRGYGANVPLYTGYTGSAVSAVHSTTSPRQAPRFSLRADRLVIGPSPDGPREVRLFDMTGRLIWEKTLPEIGATTTISIPARLAASVLISRATPQFRATDFATQFSLVVVDIKTPAR